MEFVLIDRDDRGMSGKEGAPGLTTAQKFVALRTALGLTQVQIADAMKVDRSLISKVEHGANQLTNAHTRGALMSHSRVAGASVTRALVLPAGSVRSTSALSPSTTHHRASLRSTRSMVLIVHRRRSR